MPKKPQPLKARFYPRVSLPDSNGCMLWRGATNGKGYGQLQTNRKNMYAHRIAYSLMKGDIPEDMVLDHLCRNTACVNPDHLEPVTVKENARRGIIAEVNRNRASKRTHCRRNHPLTPDNIVNRKDGVRACRTCANDLQRELRRKKAVK